VGSVDQIWLSAWLNWLSTHFHTCHVKKIAQLCGKLHSHTAEENSSVSGCKHAIAGFPFTIMSKSQSDLWMDLADAKRKQEKGIGQRTSTPAPETERRRKWAANNPEYAFENTASLLILTSYRKHAASVKKQSEKYHSMQGIGAEVSTPVDAGPSDAPSSLADTLGATLNTTTTPCTTASPNSSPNPSLASDKSPPSPPPPRPNVNPRRVSNVSVKASLSIPLSASIH
jgi:hypothetical protein